MPKGWVSATEEKLAKKIFDIYDRDKNGVLDLGEAHKFLQNIGESLTEEELEQFKKDMDTNGNNVVSWKEFIRWWKEDRKAAVDLHKSRQ